MDEPGRPHYDSLRPVETPVLPETLPPKPIQRRYALIFSIMILMSAGLFASMLTYWLLLDPVLGDYRLYGALLAGCTLLTQIASLIVHVLIFNEVRARRR
ncbi:MAG: hypothetical protein WC551_00475 [Patescibacteria group bacterium]